MAEKQKGIFAWLLGPGSLGPPVVPFYPFLGEGVSTKLDYRTKGTLILTSLLEDLVVELGQAGLHGRRSTQTIYSVRVPRPPFGYADTALGARSGRAGWTQTWVLEQQPKLYPGYKPSKRS